MASFHMVIYHADCLHIGIYDRTAHKLKTTFFQIFADSVREWGPCGNILFRREMVADGLPIHIGPYKFIKAAIFRLYFEELLGICDR